MRKIIMALLLVTVITSGCTIVENDTRKQREVDYTISDYNEVPKEVQQIVDERKEEKFQTTYTDMENTYIIIGYGKKNADGYSIKLDEIYESTTDVFVKTTFSGPDEVPENKEVTYPYIIIKIEYTEKGVKIL